MAVGCGGRTIGAHDPEEAPVSLHETIVIAEQRRHDLLDDAANLRAWAPGPCRPRPPGPALAGLATPAGLTA